MISPAGNAPDPERSAQDARIFLPARLAQNDHAVIAGYQGPDLVAGCIASRSAGVVGISNIFVPRQDALLLRAECLAAAMDLAPGRPVVGYERGDGLAAATALGFELVGPLRVWTRATAEGEEPSRPRRS